MRKIVLLEHISLDGHMAGPNGEMNWIRFDADLANFGHEVTDACDGVIYGRKTYEMMAAYWPTAGDQPNAGEHDKQHSAWVNAAERFVVSRSLQSAPWLGYRECTVVSDIKDFAEIKERPGRDIVLIGSIDTARVMIDVGLVDDYYVSVNPAVLGRGRGLFDDLRQTFDLRLVDSQVFASGVIACHYARV
jgi:dihydrofolate reductase